MIATKNEAKTNYKRTENEPTEVVENTSGLKKRTEDSPEAKSPWVTLLETLRDGYIDTPLPGPLPRRLVGRRRTSGAVV